MDLGLKDAVVVVTGGASNIGRAIALGFAAEGANLLIADIDGPQSSRVADEARNAGAQDVATHIGDLVADSQAEEVVGAAIDRWGRVDVLVNNVGWAQPTKFLNDTDRGVWQRTVDLNLFTTIAMTQAVLPRMKDAGEGSIVFIASDAADGQARHGIYGAAKAGVVALARTVAREHGRHGIRSNVVCPGFVIPQSEVEIGEGSLWRAGVQEVFGGADESDLLRTIPLGRLTSGQDIADAVLWFSSARAARQVTGQLVSVSGGFWMP
ncbi:SDR family NAD(P)-dependent oxidoreductase [Cumulibacter soli]|uniref:SDR family NAD(P)-dependent oxidoreductase n=1 Tax=Cumulibacter soli TaxID=2546344 RepID=UPI001067938A|nr:SDR family oxidoreductase [Cumulibacter soli]